MICDCNGCRFYFPLLIRLSFNLWSYLSAANIILAQHYIALHIHRRV